MQDISQAPALADLMFAHTDGTVGDIIRKGEFLIDWIDRLHYPRAAYRWNHVAIYVGNGMIVEAQPGGVRAVSLAVYDPQKISWSTGWFPDLTRDQRITIACEAKWYAKARVPYGFEDYAAIAAHTLHLPVPGLQEFIADEKSMICSQLGDRCYQLGGYHLFKDDRWPGYVTPMDLYALKPKETHP